MTLLYTEFTEHKVEKRSYYPPGSESVRRCLYLIFRTQKFNVRHKIKHASYIENIKTKNNGAIVLGGV